MNIKTKILILNTILILKFKLAYVRKRSIGSKSVKTNFIITSIKIPAVTFELICSICTEILDTRCSAVCHIKPEIFQSLFHDGKAPTTELPTNHQKKKKKKKKIFASLNQTDLFSKKKKTNQKVEVL